MQDWEDPASSIIWDSNLGFGGSGNPANEDCVEDGPFANFQVSYRAGDFEPHCLARSFNSDNGTGKFSGYRLRPEAVSKILQNQHYGDFLVQLETVSHNGIPDGVNGDFHFFTAPNGKSNLRKIHKTGY
jgi:tyrosinase